MSLDDSETNKLLPDRLSTSELVVRSFFKNYSDYSNWNGEPIKKRTDFFSQDIVNLITKRLDIVDRSFTLFDSDTACLTGIDSDFFPIYLKDNQCRGFIILLVEPSPGSDYGLWWQYALNIKDHEAPPVKSLTFG